MGEPDRRRFRRVNAPVLCQPVGIFARHDRTVQDISAGGFRVYSDERHKPGDRLDLELFFPDGTSEKVRAQVVWIDTLAAGSPAVYEIGLKYINPTSATVGRIEQLLDNPE